MEHPTDGRPRLFVGGPGQTIAGRMAALVGPNRMRFDLDPIDSAFQVIRAASVDAAASFGRLTDLLLDPGPRMRTFRPIVQGRPRTYRPPPGRYKGSAMAARATLRGGNPARSGLARLPPP